MRFYTFTNMYLSSLQIGLQSAHCISDIFAEHDDNLSYESKTVLMDWAKNHKTMILLNAGFSEEITDLGEFFDDGVNPYPWGIFREAEESLNGAVTCAGIVLPEKIYETARMLRSDKPEFGARSIKDMLWDDGEIQHELPDGTTEIWEFTKWEAQLCERLNRYGMAK